MQIIKEEKSPYVQFLLLAIYALVGVAVFAILGFALCVAIYGLDLLKDTSWMSGQTGQNIGAFKIILVAQQIGFFLAPAILLSFTERQKLTHFYQLKTPKATLLALIFLLILFSFPIMGWVNEMNQKMDLPDFLKGLEAWMKASEEQLAKTTEAILQMTTPIDFVINVLIIAAVPAVCEEFLFRGALQRTFFRVFKNPHIAIWVSAIIFSSIHFQFFGFFPRMFLGAAFGYIYFWSGSIWYGVFAHFINNGFAVAVAWYLQKNNLPMTNADKADFTWYGYLISAIITLVLLKVLKDQTVKNEN